MAAVFLMGGPALSAEPPEQQSLEASLAKTRADFLVQAAAVRDLAAASKNAITAACLRDLRCPGPFAVAHRTNGFGAAENSVEGVRRAIAAGIPLVETDIRFAQDGTLVMLHDETLNRTTNLKGPVSEKTWAELSQARLKDGQPLPRFFDLYAASRGRIVLVLDLKANAADVVAEWIASNGSFDDLIFFASDAPTLASCARARKLYPKMMVMVRLEDGLSWSDAEAAYGGLPLIVHPNPPPESLGSALNARGSRLYSSVHDLGDDMVPIWRDHKANRLLDRGVQLIDTNDPVWLKALMDGRRRPVEPAVLGR